jgi:hypothetical protein
MHYQENKRFRQNVFPKFSGPHARDAALGCLPSSPCAADNEPQHSSQPKRHRCAADLRRYAFLSANIPSPFSSYRTMDGLSGAASVIAVINISAKITSICYQYSTAVKNARDDIERVQRKVSDITHILEKLKQLLDSQDKTRLSSTHSLLDSLSQCSWELEDVKAKLDLGKTRKNISRLGFCALKWPFTSKQVDKIVSTLEGYQQTFLLALQVD